MGKTVKGHISTPADPGGSPLMMWIRNIALPCEADTCLPWPFTRVRTGYGRIGRAGKLTYAHRYICEWVHGAPPTPQHQASHSCGNGHMGCVNPRHLSWKSAAANQIDRRAHGTAKRVKVKLTPQQVDEIRAARSAGERTDIIAARFGIRESTVRDILTGRIWATAKNYVSPETVAAIRARKGHRNGEALAREFGLSGGAVRRILRAVAPSAV